MSKFPPSQLLNVSVPLNELVGDAPKKTQVQTLSWHSTWNLLHELQQNMPLSNGTVLCQNVGKVDITRVGHGIS